MDARASGPVSMDSPLAGDLHFASMEGTDDLSLPFSFEVHAWSERADIAPEELLGGSVTVHLDVGDDAGTIRHWNGRVTRFEYLQTGSDGISTYRLTLQPWIWQLGLNADCRVFQNKSIPDIVTKIFEDRGFGDYERSLLGTYPPREYVVQYRESDLEFITRLLAREGIYYFFRHDDGKHTLVLADGPEAHETVAGFEKISYAARDPHRDQTIQYVRDWAADARLEARSFAVADYDFTKPRVQLLSKAIGPEKGDSAAQIYEHPAGFSNFDSGDALARLRLDQASHEGRAWLGETNGRGMTIGAKFTLEDHPRDDQNRAYLIVGAQLTLKGHDPASGSSAEQEPFACSFRAIGSDATFRTSWRLAQPVVRGPQTATVVGPSGQEIWTDQYGRIKVQFNWDREGQRDENSSCWMRVAQVWAGQGWGAQFIPRIGQEVIVDFLEGDPDRPIVTGSVYNGANAVPYSLPANQTQSGVRTRSTPGGGVTAGNEIRFEDRTGQEDLYIHAQGTQTIVVERDQSAQLRANRAMTVTGTETVNIGGGRVTNIALADALSVAGAAATNVGGDQALTVAGSASTTVTGAYTLSVTGAATETVQGNLTRSVTGAVQETLSGDVTRTTTGKVSSQTKGATQLAFATDYTERHLGHRTVIVGSGSAHRTGVVHVEGTARGYVSKLLELEVLEGITVICGDSQILVTPKGITLNSPNIEFVSPTVTARASTFTVTATGDLTLGGNTVTASTSGAKMALDSSSASLLASAVKLGSGSGSSSSSNDKPVTITRVIMKDSKGKPRANARVLLEKDGEQRMTVLDKDGTLELIGDATYKVSFPDDDVK